LTAFGYSRSFRPAASEKRACRQRIDRFERDKHMSEAKKSFMQELDEWTDENVIDPLHVAITDGDSDECDAVRENVKKAIRQKVLDSYHNGQKAPARTKPEKARPWK
jgi:hypothetical protein